MARLVMNDGERITVSGNVNIFGTSGAQSVKILNNDGSIVFDPSFNLGKDVIEFEQTKSAFVGRISGSNLLLSDGDTQIIIPIGTKGAALKFADGSSTLIYDTSSGKVLLGDTVIDQKFAPIAATLINTAFASNAPLGEVAGTKINFKEIAISEKIKSDDSGNRVTFTLSNKTADKISVYWIDRDGIEIKYGDLTVGSTWKQPTLSSHPWIIRDADGKALAQFFPGQGAAELSTAGFKVLNLDAEQNSLARFGSWNTYQGYGVINVAKALDVEPSGVNLPDGKSNHNSLELIDAPAAWLAGLTGANVKVAVIDAGIAVNPEVGAFVANKDFVDGDMDGAPEAGSYRDHGLGVAAIISANKDYPKNEDTTGVAPDSSIMNVRVGNNGGSPMPNIIAGIRWATDNGAKVLMIPLQSSLNFADKELIDAIDYAYSKNTVTVLIGGNFSIYGGSGLALAAKNGGALAVGNFDAAAAKLFSSSNQAGTDPWNWVVASSTGYYPNGDGGYKYWNDGGTSFAGPYVAGLAALLFEQNPTWTAKQVIERILMTSSTTYVEGLTALRVQGGNGSESFVGTTGNDWLRGGGGSDYLEGYLGDDILDGGDGDDTLYGGAGSDRLIGGAGSDRFLFNKLPDIAGVDTIVDFSIQEDKIVLKRSVFSALSESLSQENFLRVNGNMGLMTSTTRLLYDSSNGGLYYDSDGNGPQNSMLFAMLMGTPVIDFTSFILT
jgi:Ca2+-binding RTX toxin-like protein